MRAWILVLVVVACGKGRSPPGTGSATPGSASESRGQQASEFRGLVISKDAVTLDGKSLGFAPERLTKEWGRLSDVLSKAKARHMLMVGFTPDAPAAGVLAVVRAVRESGRMPTSLEALDNPRFKSVCQLLDPEPPEQDRDHVHERLSLELEPKQRMLGVSVINEFQVFDPPYTQFAETLHKHKISALFFDRQDIEVAAAPGVTGLDLASAINDVCNEGFDRVIPLGLDELATRYHPGATLADPSPPPSAP